jgi:hypothetical protein
MHVVRVSSPLVLLLFVASGSPIAGTSLPAVKRLGNG